MPDQPTYLTEAILTIQHELQTALDYIETVVSQEPSELGAALSLLTVDNLRIRIPFILQVEQETHPIPPEKAPFVTGLTLSKEELARLKKRLLSREGLLVGLEKGQLGKFAKIRVISPTPPPAGEAPLGAELVGQIELTFTRVPRALEPEEPEVPAPEEGFPGAAPTPDVIGRTLDEATELLVSSNWRFEAHAAGEEEVAQVPEAAHGRVLQQKPKAGEQVDKVTTVVRFWVALSNLPVQDIDGIGEKLSDRLAEIGITTVGQFSLTRVEQVAQALGVSESRAREFIDMATFMSRLAIAQLSDEVVELLVKGAKVRSMDELAAADPAELYKACMEAIERGRVRVPKGFSFTSGNVARWVEMAQS